MHVVIKAYCPRVGKRTVFGRLPSGPTSFDPTQGKRLVWERTYATLDEALRVYSQTSYPEGWVLIWSVKDGTPTPQN